MDLTDLSTLSRLLDEALDLDATVREDWLAALAPEHSRLLPQLRRMLAELQTPNGFMSDGPRLAEAADDIQRHAGDGIGPYRLRREIGRGGMGAVWLAERVDGGLQRDVALKLPRLAWGAGLAARMARERDIGARLEHPNIARLYDAGIDAGGQPYLALEYIAGEPIDTWCSARQLPLNERLRLIVQVARALTYAHGRLVVHRDIKPSNVLVGSDGQAHLLDFGIAKLLLPETVDERLTQEHSRVLTPHYASPEQMRGEPVTVQCDVYALGMLAYELVVGEHPYAEHKSLAAVEQAMRAGEPPPPSQRASDPTHARALRGEVDAIIAKAIRHEPARRYASAEALADDIERHLAGERVLARPDSLGYRIAKTLKRHRTAFGAGAAIAAAVLAGAAVALVQAQRANAQAERASVVKQFIVDVFKVNARQAPADAGLRQLPAELLLERGASLIEKTFAGKPELQAELYGVVGGIFVDMGAVQMAADYAGRQVRLLDGLAAPAAERASAALLFGEALLGQGRLVEAQAQAERVPALAAQDRALQAQAQLLLARVLVQQSRHAEGLQALDRFEREYGSSAPALGARAKVLRAGVLARIDRFDEAVPLYQAGIDQALAAEGPQSVTAIDAQLALAFGLANRNRLAESQAPREAALAALRASGGPGDIRAAHDESALYWSMFSMDQVSAEEAVRVIERNRDALVTRALVPAAVKAAVDLNLGSVLLDWGDIQRAAPLITASAATLGSRQSVADQFHLVGQQATVALYAGRHDEAEVFLRRRLELQQAGGRTEHPMVAYDRAFLALNFIMQGRFDDAEATLAAAPDFDAVARRRNWPLKDGHAEPFAVVRRVLVRSRLERGDAAGARALMLDDATDSDNKFPLDDRVLRAAVLCNTGQPAAGLAIFDEQLAWHAKVDYASHPDVGRMQALAGLCAFAAGQTRRARELAAAAGRVFEAQPHVSAYFKAPLVALRQRLAGIAPRPSPRVRG